MAQNAGVAVRPVVEVESPAVALELAARGVGDTLISLPLAHAPAMGRAVGVLTGRVGVWGAADTREGAAAADGQDEEPGPSLASLRWPSLADALPAGPLREQLAKVTGIRALLPVVKATSRNTIRCKRLCGSSTLKLKSGG